MIYAAKTMRDDFYKQLFIVAVAVTASQLSLRYIESPVQLGRQVPKGQVSQGWSQLAFLVAQGRKGCLCCDDGVMFLPETNLGVQVRTWKATDRTKIKNVTVPLENGQKAVKRLYSKIQAAGTEPGAAEREYDLLETDAYCVQACKPEGLFTFPFL